MTPKFPFEASLEDIRANPEIFVSSVNACLESEFLVLPKGAGFVEYPIFETGYEALKKASSGFSRLIATEIVPTILSVPISLIGLKGVVVGEGDTYEEALADVKSAIRFHAETFGQDAFQCDESILEAFVAETKVAI